LRLQLALLAGNDLAIHAAPRERKMKMSNAEQIETIRELTLDELQAVSGGGDASGDDLGGDFDGGGPAPTRVEGLLTRQQRHARA
jgi:hypothetical protein